MTKIELKQLYDSLMGVITELSNRITTLEKQTHTQFTNHVSQHKWDKFARIIYFALVIIMFCFLKWGS